MSSMEDFWRLFGPLALFLRLPVCFWPATAAAVDSSSPSPITSAATEQAALCMAEPDCPLVGSRRYSCKPKSQSKFDLVVSGGCNTAQGTRHSCSNSSYISPRHLCCLAAKPRTSTSRPVGLEQHLLSNPVAASSNAQAGVSAVRLPQCTKINSTQCCMRATCHPPASAP
jgi:hypothetical protein